MVKTTASIPGNASETFRQTSKDQKLSFLKQRDIIIRERANIPPSLPKPQPTASYWQDSPGSIATHRTTLSLPESASVVVIGSGITGSSLAYNLLSQPSPPSVVLLEARTACSGATGRNGGHTKCASYRSFLDNLKSMGEAEAAKIVRYEYTCMKAVHAFARQHGIACDSWEGDTVDVFYDESQWKAAKEAVTQLQRVLGKRDPAARYHFWDAHEAEKKFLTSGTFGALSYEAGSMSAYKLVTGSLELAIAKGLNLQTDTPALRIHRDAAVWTIETPRGKIRTGKIVLATNGYTARLYPALQGTIVPLRGHVTAQRPGNVMPPEGLATTYTFVYEDGYEYMIPRPQGSTNAGDIVIGGGMPETEEQSLYEFGTVDDTTTDATIVNYLHNCTEAYFGTNWGGDHADGRIRKAWTGIMGYSSDGFPLVGPVPGEQGLFIAASFQGHGMVLCFLAAQAVTRMMHGDDDQELHQWFPKAFRIREERMKMKFRGRHQSILLNELQSHVENLLPPMTHGHVGGDILVHQDHFRKE